MKVKLLMRATCFFVLFVFVLLLSACADRGFSGDLLSKKHCFRKHTKPVVNKNVAIKMECSSRINIIYPEKYKYTDPVFNPNNKNEIAYIRSAIDNNVLGQPQLWTFNFCTGKTKQLAAVISNAADWSVKDWLIFRGAGGELRKIKSNGDSLTTLPKIEGATLPPKWNEKGDLFALRLVNRRKEDVILVATEHGKGVGSFSDFVLNKWDWVDKQISYVEAGDGKQEIKMFNFESRTSHTIETVNNFRSSDSLFLSTIYFKEKEIVFWNQKRQIYYTDVLSKKRTLVAKGADNRMYNKIALSADGKTIVANRVDQTNISACERGERWSLVLIDVETGAERMIEFPE